MPTPIPTPPDNGLGILNYAESLVKIVSPLVMAIITLALWAFRQQSLTQDKQADALERHIRDDDAVHDKLFTQIRAVEKDQAELRGEHNNCDCTKSDKPMYRRI